MGGACVNLEREDLPTFWHRDRGHTLARRPRWNA
jgi:hypothetical protein